MTRHASLAAAATLGISIVGIGGALSPAVANPIDLMGYAGPVAINLSSYESFTGAGTVAVGDTGYGVFVVTSITAAADDGSISAGETIWSPGGSNGQIAGVFDGVTVSSTSPTAGGDSIQNSGGVLEFFNISSLPNVSQGTGGYIAGGCTSIDTLCYNTLTNVAGYTTPILTMDLVPGADATDPTATLEANTNGLTIPFDGSATGFMDITGGNDAGQFEIGGAITALGTPADMSLIDDFCGNAAGCNGAVGSIGNWNELDNGTISATVAGAATVPEPASLSLFGVALVGFGFLRRCKRKAA